MVELLAHGLDAVSFPGPPRNQTAVQSRRARNGLEPVGDCVAEESRDAVLDGLRVGPERRRHHGENKRFTRVTGR